MIDFDELERRMHEAFRTHTTMEEWQKAEFALSAMLRAKAPELTAMARIGAKAYESEHSGVTKSSGSNSS